MTVTRRLMALTLAATPALTAARAQSGEGLPACERRVDFPGGSYARLRLIGSKEVLITARIRTGGGQPLHVDVRQRTRAREARHGLYMEAEGSVTIEPIVPGSAPVEDFAVTVDTLTGRGGGYLRFPLHPLAQGNRAMLVRILRGETMQVSWRDASGGTVRRESRVDPEDVARLNARIGEAVRALEDESGSECAPMAPGLPCYLTTAAVGVVGLADDCWELTSLRGFRDGVLERTESGRELVADYYRRAPGIVARISARADARTVWLRTYAFGVLPCALLARAGLNGAATRLYRRMTLRLEALAT